MGKINSTIRFNDELATLLQKTARHVDKSESDVVRATAVFIRNGKTVEQTDVPETLYKTGGEIVKNFRFSLPDIPPEEFRRILAARCLIELQKPKARIYRSYAAEAKIADREPRTLEEAEGVTCVILKIKE